MLTKLNNITDLDQNLKNEVFTFLYITMPNCSVCHGLQPQIEGILKGFPEIHGYVMDAGEVPEIVGKYEVYAAPTLILFVDGKEYLREARFVRTEQLHEQIAKIYKGRLDQ